MSLSEAGSLSIIVITFCLSVFKEHLIFLWTYVLDKNCILQTHISFCLLWSTYMARCGAQSAKNAKNAQKKKFVFKVWLHAKSSKAWFFLNVDSETYRKRLLTKKAPFLYFRPFLWLAYLFHIISWNIYWILNSVIDNL